MGGEITIACMCVLLLCDVYKGMEAMLFRETCVLFYKFAGMILGRGDLKQISVMRWAEA